MHTCNYFMKKGVFLKGDSYVCALIIKDGEYVCALTHSLCHNPKCALCAITHSVCPNPIMVDVVW